MIEAWINPISQNWGVRPKIRIDGFLINTYLASVDVFDHMLRFRFDEDFFHRYAARNVDSIIASVPVQHREDASYISKYFGLSGGNEGLVTEIRSILDAKHSFHNDT